MFAVGSHAIKAFSRSAAIYSGSGSILHVLILRLLLLLLLVLVPANARVTHDNAAPSESSAAFRNIQSLDNGNVELQRAFAGHKAAVTEEELHPTVMYKEDYVSEDYDPDRSESESFKQRRWRERHRKAKRLHRNSIEHYNVIKPEVVYFDILPKKPIIDDISRLEETSAQVELVPLFPYGNKREALNQRKRRSAFQSNDQQQQQQQEQRRIKRNSYYNVYDKGTGAAGVAFNENLSRPPYLNYPDYTHLTLGNPISTVFVRHPVQGKRPLPLPQPAPARMPGSASSNTGQITVGTRNDFSEDYDDRPVWGRQPISQPAAPRPFLPVAVTTTTTRRPTRRPTQTDSDSDFWHNSNPENADFSLFTSTESPRLAVTTSAQTASTARAWASTVYPTRRIWRQQQPQQPQQQPQQSQERPVAIEHQRAPAATATATATSAGAGAGAGAVSSNAKDSFRIIFPQRAADAPISSQCRLAVNYCCGRPNYVERYDCFDNWHCTTTIADISSLCG